MNQNTTSSSPHIPWHPAFFQAIQLELEQYKDLLEFQSEYRLTAEPLEIDVVIIKKDPALTIEKNIARIFKQVNLLEYKNPDDYFSVYDFFKVFGYACLYAALNKIDIRDMTISIVETRHPRDLFTYIEEDRNCRIVENFPGIYGISGYPITLQVIESKKLSLPENLWLKGLSNDLNSEAAVVILKESRKRGRDDSLAAYLYAVLSANTRTVQEVLQVANNGELTLDEVLEEAGLTAKWEKRGEARGEARGEKNGWNKALELLRQGYTVEQLEQMDPSPSTNSS
jgi:hypothetical protein